MEGTSSKFPTLWKSWPSLDCTVTWKTYWVFSPWPPVSRESDSVPGISCLRWSRDLTYTKDHHLCFSFFLLLLRFAWIVIGLILNVLHLFFLRYMSFCRLRVCSVRDTQRDPCKSFKWGTEVHTFLDQRENHIALQWITGSRWHYFATIYFKTKIILLCIVCFAFFFLISSRDGKDQKILKT